MKLAVHFGAGNIGRGFIAPVLFENDYQVIFVDVNKDKIPLLTCTGKDSHGHMFNFLRAFLPNQEQ